MASDKTAYDFSTHRISFLIKALLDTNKVTTRYTAEDLTSKAQIIIQELTKLDVDFRPADVKFDPTSIEKFVDDALIAISELSSKTDIEPRKRQSKVEALNIVIKEILDIQKYLIQKNTRDIIKPISELLADDQFDYKKFDVDLGSLVERLTDAKDKLPTTEQPKTKKRKRKKKGDVKRRAVIIEEAPVETHDYALKDMRTDIRKLSSENKKQTEDLLSAITFALKHVTPLRNEEIEREKAQQAEEAARKEQLRIAILKKAEKKQKAQELKDKKEPPKKEKKERTWEKAKPKSEAKQTVLFSRSQIQDITLHTNKIKDNDKLKPKKSEAISAVLETAYMLNQKEDRAEKNKLQTDWPNKLIAAKNNKQLNSVIDSILGSIPEDKNPQMFKPEEYSPWEHLKVRLEKAKETKPDRKFFTKLMRKQR